MMPTLESLVAREVAIKTTFGNTSETSDDKVGIMTIIGTHLFPILCVFM